MKTEKETALILGFPRLLSRGLTTAALRENSQNRVLLLVHEKDHNDAKEFKSQLSRSEQRRLRILIGDENAREFGLSGREAKDVFLRATLVFVPLSMSGATRKQQERRLSGLSHLLQWAEDFERLNRILLFSTAFVSGDRTGVIMEEDLEFGQNLRTPYEQAMFVAEQLARAAMPRLPITVLRPSAMIGHSRTGDASGLTEGPSYLWSMMLRWPTEMPFFVPGTGVVPFNIVPIDYVVQASWALATDPVARGRTFHLTDPNPVSTRQAFELFADIADRPKPRFGQWFATLVKRSLKATGTETLVPVITALMGELSQDVRYSCAGTLERLADTEIRCPAFDDYADTLVSWMAEVERTNRSHQSD